MAFPSFAISARLKRRSRGVLARRRTPFPGLVSIFPRRTACSKMAWSVDIVRAATPSPTGRGAAAAARAGLCGLASGDIGLGALDIAEGQRADLARAEQRPDVRLDPAAIHRECRGLDRPAPPTEDPSRLGLGQIPIAERGHRDGVAVWRGRQPRDRSPWRRCSECPRPPVAPAPPSSSRSGRSPCGDAGPPGSGTVR